MHLFVIHHFISRMLGSDLLFNVILLYLFFYLKLEYFHILASHFFFQYYYFLFLKHQISLNEMCAHTRRSGLSMVTRGHFSFCLSINLSIFLSHCFAPRSQLHTVCFWCGSFMVMNSRKACESFFCFLCVCKLFMSVLSSRLLLVVCVLISLPGAVYICISVS